MRDKHSFATEMYQIIWDGLRPSLSCADTFSSRLQHLTISTETDSGIFANACGYVVGLELSRLAVIEKDQTNNKFNPTGINVNNRMIFHGSRD